MKKNSSLTLTKSAREKCYATAMRYIFYADVYFIQNFVIKMAALYLALYASKEYTITESLKGIGKISLVAFVGTLFEVLGLIFGANFLGFVLIVNFMELPIMFLFVIGRKRKKLISLIFLGYFFTMLINAVLEILWNQFGEKGGFLFFILFSCGIVIVGVRIWKSHTRMQKGIFHVQIFHRGKSIDVKGFYDSGNQLMDPYTNQGVHIISKQLFERLEIKQDYVFIPYEALGTKAGLLEVYYIEALVVEGEHTRKIIENCPIGVTKDNLFKGKNYEIILNEEVF